MDDGTHGREATPSCVNRNGSVGYRRKPEAGCHPERSEGSLKKREAFRRAYDGFDPAKVARYAARDRKRLLADAGIIRNRLKIEAAIANARTILDLRERHGSFHAWIAAHHPRPKAEWVRLFKQTFRFTGGEIVGEFLISTGVLPGAHRESCPVYRKILEQKPMWRIG